MSDSVQLQASKSDATLSVPVDASKQDSSDLKLQMAMYTLIASHLKESLRASESSNASDGSTNSCDVMVRLLELQSVLSNQGNQFTAASIQANAAVNEVVNNFVDELIKRMAKAAHLPDPDDIQKDLEELSKLTDEVEKYMKDHKSEQGKYNAAKAAYEAAVAKLNAAQNALKKAQEDYSSAQSQYNKDKAAYEKAEKDGDTKAAAKYKKDMDQDQSNMNAAQVQIKSAQQDIASAKAAESQAQSEMSQAQSAMDNDNSELLKLKGQLSAFENKINDPKVKEFIENIVKDIDSGTYNAADVQTNAQDLTSRLNYLINYVKQYVQENFERQMQLIPLDQLQSLVGTAGTKTIEELKQMLKAALLHILNSNKTVSRNFRTTSNELDKTQHQSLVETNNAYNRRHDLPIEYRSI